MPSLCHTHRHGRPFVPRQLQALGVESRQMLDEALAEFGAVVHPGQDSLLKSLS